MLRPMSVSSTIKSTAAAVFFSNAASGIGVLYRTKNSNLCCALRNSSRQSLNSFQSSRTKASGYPGLGLPLTAGRILFDHVTAGVDCDVKIPQSVR